MTMSLSPDMRRYLAEFVCSRPPVVQDLMRAWPPMATVKTNPGITLLVPAPGIEGTVESYFEDGQLGIVAVASIPHPVHGWGDTVPGQQLKAAVDPEQLELVREGDITRADVARALAAGGSA